MNRKFNNENPRQRSAVSTTSSKRVPSARAGTVLQEIFARKRETEQLRSEKHSAVAQYYDKWGRITSRFENWTTPEYYEKSDQLLRKDEEERQRREALAERQQKLKELFNRENDIWNKEAQDREKEKIKPFSTKHNVDVLQRLNAALSEQENRKKEIEVKLYSQWRFGMTRNDLILESKNHHQAMAKLNWMDQQVEQQLERDRSERELARMEMQRKSDQLRQEEIELESKRYREQEIQELKRSLEFHVSELKSQDKDSRILKESNVVLTEVKKNLDLKLVELTEAAKNQVEKVFSLHNLRKLKNLIRERCKEVHEAIYQDILQLESIREMSRRPVLTSKEEKHFQLLSYKFSDELAAVQSDMEAFTTRYDSELKSMLIKQQQSWKDNAQTRLRLLRSLLIDLIDRCVSLMESNNEEATSLIPVKESHLKSIEDLNRKLTMLSQELVQIDSPAKYEHSKDPVPTAVKDVSNNYKSLEEKLTELRLPVEKDSDGSKNAPKYGRKKVAWF